MPRKALVPLLTRRSSKKQEPRLDAITELVAQGMSEEEAIAIVDAREDASRNRVPSDISAGGDALSLGVPGKSIEAEELKREEDRADQSPALGPLPEAPEQVGRQTPLRILELLGNVGGSIMDSRAIGKANKATAQAQARANLINTLRGRQTASVSPRRPKSGILATLARGLGGGARAIREGREAEAAGEQSRFTNEMSLEEAGQQRFDLYTDRLKARAEMEDAGGGPEYEYGISSDIERTLIPLAKKLYDSPYDMLDQDRVKEAIRNAFPNLSPEEINFHMPQYAAYVTDAHDKIQVAQREKLSEILSEVSENKSKVSPEGLLDSFQTQVAVLGIPISQEVGERVAANFEMSEQDVELRDEARRSFGRMVALRSGISRIVKRISDPAFAEHLEFLKANIDHLKAASLFKGTLGRTLDPEVKSVMTELGFTRELLLRTFTGAAAPHTEFVRFQNEFVGGLISGPEILTEQLKTLDYSLRGLQVGLLKASKNPWGAVEPAIDGGNTDRVERALELDRKLFEARRKEEQEQEQGDE